MHEEVGSSTSVLLALLFVLALYSANVAEVSIGQVMLRLVVVLCVTGDAFAM